MAGMEAWVVEQLIGCLVNDPRSMEIGAGEGAGLLRAGFRRAE